MLKLLITAYTIYWRIYYCGATVVTVPPCTVDPLKIISCP